HRLNFHYVDGPDRLLEPMIRKGDKHEVVRWRDVFELLPKHILGSARKETAIVASARMTNEELYLVKRLADLLEIDMVDVVPREGEADDYLISADQNPNTEGAKVVLGLDKPGSKLSKIRGALEAGDLKTLLVFGEDLTAEAGFSRESLNKVDFLLCMHTLANPTADAATVVMPSATAFEKRGSMINVTGRLQRLNQAVDLPGQARDDWELLRDLTQEVTGSNGVHGVDDVFRMMASAVKEFEGLTWSKIGDQGLPLLETGVKIPLLEKEAERKAKGLIVG
ncbi:MAG: molybdopterin-dependent oxidoreductase, partial [Verrucomicrobiota bacterium]